MKHASLCVLAYKRPLMLKLCLESIMATADYPYTIIVNLDGDDSGNAEYLFDLYKRKKISTLILNAGDNRGVGRSFQNCLGAAEGDYIFKIDTDLIFKQGWLSLAIRIFENNTDIAAVSLFDYRNYDPNDTRFNIIEERVNCRIVDDFVSSVYGFRAKDAAVWLQDGRGTNDRGTLDDDGLHTHLQTQRGKLAITKKDYVTNHGFGVGKSVYISGTEEAPFKTPTADTPLVYKRGLTD